MKKGVKTSKKSKRIVFFAMLASTIKKMLSYVKKIVLGCFYILLKKSIKLL
jgi:hypothetical protein